MLNFLSILGGLFGGDRAGPDLKIIIVKGYGKTNVIIESLKGQFRFPFENSTKVGSQVTQVEQGFRVTVAGELEVKHIFTTATNKVRISIRIPEGESQPVITLNLPETIHAHFERQVVSQECVRGPASTMDGLHDGIGVFTVNNQEELDALISQIQAGRVQQRGSADRSASNGKDAASSAKRPAGAGADLSGQHTPNNKPGSYQTPASGPGKRA